MNYRFGKTANSLDSSNRSSAVTRVRSYTLAVAARKRSAGSRWAKPILRLLVALRIQQFNEPLGMLGLAVPFFGLGVRERHGVYETHTVVRQE